MKVLQYTFIFLNIFVSVKLMMWLDVSQHIASPAQVLTEQILALTGNNSPPLEPLHHKRMLQ